MATYSKFLSLISGVGRMVDLSTNTLQVGALEIGSILLSQTSSYAFFSGTIPGTATAVVIQANAPGTAGNSIALAFSGSNTIAQEIATWNLAHPLNMAHLVSGNGAQTPTTGTTTLSGGVDGGSSLIGDNSVYTNFTPTAATVAGALAGIDAALFGITGSAIDSLTGDVTATGPGAAAATIQKIQGNTVSGTTGTGNVVFSNAPTLTGLLSGGSATFTGAISASNFSGSSSGTNTGDQTITLTGEATGSGTGSFAVTLSNAAVISKVLTGYVSGAGTITAADSILTAIEKLNGNAGTYLPLAGGTMSGAINMGGNQINNMAAGTVATDAVNLGQVILRNGTNAFTADQSLGGFKLTNVADPLSAQDAATKNYVDNLAHGLSWKHVVRTASTANLNLASMPATVDGVTLVSGDRFLAKDQTTSSQNGIYIFNGTGSAATRSLDTNTAITLQWATVEVGPDSATQAGYIYRESDDITTLGTDPVAFIIVSHGLDWTFNNGLSVTGNQVNVAPGNASLLATAGSLIVQEDPAGAIITTASGIAIQLATSNPGLVITSDHLDVKYNPAGAIIPSASGIAIQLEASNPTLQISSNQLGVKLDPAGAIITGAAGIKVQLNPTNPGLAITSDQLDVKYNPAGAIVATSTGIAANPDNTSIDINGSNQLEVKNAGVTAAKLNTNAFDQTTITGGGGAAAVVQSAPLLQKTLVAGESFAANTSFLVRWGKNSLSETADRVYKADYDTTVDDKFWVIGIAQSPTAVSAGQNIPVTIRGSLPIGSSDSAFATGDIGKPVWLTSAGTYSTTPPSASLQADFKAAIVESTTKFWVDGQMMGVN